MLFPSNSKDAKCIMLRLLEVASRTATIWFDSLTVSPWRLGVTVCSKSFRLTSKFDLRIFVSCSCGPCAPPSLDCALPQVGFPPGDASWRHMTSLGVAGLKYLEPSCSAGGRDLVMPPVSECLSLRPAATGDDDSCRHRRMMSLAFLTLSCRCARSGHGTQGSQARRPRFVFVPTLHIPFFV